jgi:hypothetical protein
MASGLWQWAWERPRPMRKEQRERLELATSIVVAIALLSPDCVAIGLSGFKFGVTIHQGMSCDRLRRPLRFASIIDGKEPHHVLMCVSSSATRLRSTEEMFDGDGERTRCRLEGGE